MSETLKIHSLINVSSKTTHMICSHKNDSVQVKKSLGNNVTGNVDKYVDVTYWIKNGGKTSQVVHQIQLPGYGM